MMAFVVCLSRAPCVAVGALAGSSNVGVNSLKKLNIADMNAVWLWSGPGIVKNDCSFGSVLVPTGTRSLALHSFCMSMSSPARYIGLTLAFRACWLVFSMRSLNRKWKLLTLSA